MRKVIFSLLAVVLLSLSTTACIITPAAGITAVEFGAKLYLAAKEAKKSNPDKFSERAKFYAQLYCEFRDDHALQWDEIRGAAISNSAPEWAVAMVQEQIDKGCGLEKG
jgi:hypothetical protein